MTNLHPKRRWFVPTPGHLLVALLAVEGFLFLAERCRWMSKGWPVVMAVASVGAFLLLMFLWFLAALIFRLRFQFSILSLLLLPVVVATAFGWLVPEMEQARKQRKVVEEIMEAGGQVCYDYQQSFHDTTSKPPEPAWLRGLLGDDLFADVTMVEFNFGSAQVSDAGLEHLKGLTQLQWLYLSNTAISDAGLEHLRGLTQLQWLDLLNTNVSDAGLEHLKGLTRLQELRLGGTGVSDAGVKKLKQVLPKCQFLP